MYKYIPHPPLLCPQISAEETSLETDLLNNYNLQLTLNCINEKGSSNHRTWTPQLQNLYFPTSSQPVKKILPGNAQTGIQLYWHFNFLVKTASSQVGTDLKYRREMMMTPLYESFLQDATGGTPSTAPDQVPLCSCDGCPSLKELTKDKWLLFTLSESIDILCFTDKHANRLISDSKYSYQVEYIESFDNTNIVPDIM